MRSRAQTLHVSTVKNRVCCSIGRSCATRVGHATIAKAVSVEPANRTCFARFSKKHPLIGEMIEWSFHVCVTRSRQTSLCGRMSSLE
eukprot:scaffold17320_cov76-Amphora_coffeaeformis.AAC.2